MHKPAPPDTRPGIDTPRLYDWLMFLLTRGRERRYRDRVLDIAGVTDGTRMLDIGCGTGTLAIAAWRRAQPGGHIVGTDVSKDMVDVARRKARRAQAEVEFRLGDATSLPTKAGQFDLAVINTVLHAVPLDQRQSCIAEARRILKPAGRLVIIDFGGSADDRKHWIARHGAHGEFDIDDLREPMAEAGFRNVEGAELGWLSLRFLRATNG